QVVAVGVIERVFLIDAGKLQPGVDGKTALQNVQVNGLAGIIDTHVLKLVAVKFALERDVGHRRKLQLVVAGYKFTVKIGARRINDHGVQHFGWISLKINLLVKILVIARGDIYVKRGKGCSEMLPYGLKAIAQRAAVPEVEPDG